MKIYQKSLPRIFNPIKGITLKDMGNIHLNCDEQITFVTDSLKSNDVVKKEWGFYLSNSLNSNLKLKGFKTALVESSFNDTKTLFINLVEIEMIDKFHDYLKTYNCRIICWLDEWVV